MHLHVHSPHPQWWYSFSAVELVESPLMDQREPRGFTKLLLPKETRWYVEKHLRSLARNSWVQVLPGSLISRVLSKLLDLCDSTEFLITKWGQSLHRVGMRIKCDNIQRWAESSSSYFLSVHVRDRNKVGGQDLRWRWN